MRAFILAAIAACATIATPATLTPSTTTVYVSDLTETHASIGWGRLGKDVSVSATPLRLNGVTFAKGLGTHAVSDVRYDLAGLCTRFDAVIGVDDAVTAGSVRFQVLADGVLLYDTSAVVGRPMTGADPGLRVSVDVSGRRALSLRVSDGADGIGKDHADWADARVTCATGALRPLRLSSYLSDVAASSATIGWGTIRKDLSVQGSPLRLNGITYAKGIGTHANSDIRYNLGRTCSMFRAVIGVDDAVTRGSVRFQVWTDGTLQYDSVGVVGGNMTGADPGVAVSVAVAGVQELRLVAADGGDGIGSDHADWANPIVTCSPPVQEPVLSASDVTVSHLSDRAPAYAAIGWGTIGKDVSVEGRPLRLNGVSYAKGIGTHASSDIRYDLAGACSTFTAIVGVDDEVGTRGTIRFQVWADGTLLYDSLTVVGGNLTGSHPGQPVAVDVSGRQELRLVVADGGDGIGGDHADWADAKVTCVSRTVAFAYWNLAGGNGVKHLAATNFLNPAKPFTCTNTAGAPLDDSSYETGTGAAILQSDGAMTEALVHHITGDPAVVALGVGEAWGGAETSRLAAVIGWSTANVTMKNDGDIILTRYGFTEQGLSPPIGQTGAEIHKALYANVCLDGPCSRTLPFFAVHTQSAQGEYDAFMKTLLAYVDSMVPVGRPRIVMGDFNAWDRLTDPHICVSGSEPGASHEEGIRRIIANGYTDMLRLKNPTVNRYTGQLNKLAYNQYVSSCTVVAGLPQGHPYKAIDHAYAKYVAEADIVAAQKFGIPVGGFGNCAASDHLGVKVTVRVR